MFALASTLRTTLAFGVVAAAITTSLPLTAQAADSSQVKMPATHGDMCKMMHAKPMEVMKMMDTDKNGSVSKEEYMKFHEAMFDKMDKNKDQEIDHQEWVDSIHTSG
ncbi:MAG TPA: hypothetical protein VMK12_10440 [Anaeromyxobacteraceae bacterium]|nr:hypothetical protein [Anaeromyxobacteraceae bacterium]